MATIYPTQGTCSKAIAIDVQEGIVTDVRFEGGCPGNLQAISLLVRGMKVEDVIQKLSGVTCGDKTTSCADQLAKALQQQVAPRP